MKRFISIINIALLSLLILQTGLTNVEAYSTSFSLELAKRVIKELPFNWYYSFDSYTNMISSGIVDSRDEQTSQFYTPSNASGNLIDNALQAYSNIINKLDEGDISGASYELGKLVNYIAYLSNPFRTTDLKNATLAQRLESLVLTEDLSNVTLNKNLNISDIREALAGIGFKAISLASNINKTALANNKREQTLISFVKEMFSHSASVLYAILLKAIKTHEANTVNKNVVYITTLLAIIFAIILVANRKKLKHLK